MTTKTTVKHKEMPSKAHRVVIETADNGYTVHSSHAGPMMGEDKPHVFTHHAPMLKHVKKELGVHKGASEGDEAGD